MAANAVLERETFEISRAAEYFDASELQKQTGQPASRFASVVLKELVDNACDAAESIEVAPAIEIETRRANGLIRISVTDNGNGLPADAIKKIADFSTRTSDKVAYRSVTRGAQGNALKTIIGIPHALGHAEPVTIRARGVESRIYAKIDPAGALHVNPVIRQVETGAGTSVAVALPSHRQDFDPIRWARAFALFNPHTSVKIRVFDEDAHLANDDEEETAEFYQSTVSYPDNWQKFLPTDPTSPHWYDVAALKRLVFALIGVAHKGGRDLTLRDFVRQFNGLSGTLKAKAVCDQLLQVSRLRDFEEREADVSLLLDVMRANARPVNPLALGLVGEDHIRACFEDWYGVKRFWYRKETGDLNGVPFVVEIAVAETRKPSDSAYVGLNFSPTYEDPFAGAYLNAGDIEYSVGLGGFLSQAHANTGGYEQGHGDPCTAVAAHLVCPALQDMFKDRGKTRLELPRGIARAIADALWRTTKELYREGKQRRRDANKAERRSEAREKPQDMTLKDAVFAVIPQAEKETTHDGQFFVFKRNFFYHVRDLIQSLTPKELDYDYFAQNLLVQFQKAFGKIKKLLSDPRGWLIEPHTGKTTRLGTREVDNYVLPLHLYNKILYTEKQGLWEYLQFGKFAERYDMAIIMGQGYATEAVRTLIERADKERNYRVFVLHDADPDGYNIARTLREETARMPGYKVDVIDLGLTYDDAMAMGLKPEKFSRKKALASALELSPLALKAFTGVKVGKKQWKDCLRVELDKLDYPTLIKYLDEKLIQHAATDKVIPPDSYLRSDVADIFAADVLVETQTVIDEMFDVHKIASDLAEELKKEIKLDGAREWIEQAFADNPALSWRNVVRNKLRKEIEARSDAIKDAVRAALED